MVYFPAQNLNILFNVNDINIDYLHTQTTGYSMKKPLKAILLNAFVFPGAGHFLYKYPISGAIFAIAFMIPLGIIFSTVIIKTNELILQIQNGLIPLDIYSITTSVNQLVASETQTLNIYTYIMMGSWLLRIIDIYRVSRTKKEALSFNK